MRRFYWQRQSDKCPIAVCLQSCFGALDTVMVAVLPPAYRQKSAGEFCFHQVATD
jgi:hypothetical protein